MSLFLQKRFMGRTEEQAQVKTIAKKIIRELNVHKKHI